MAEHSHSDPRLSDAFFLTVIIPAFNEEPTILSVLEAVSKLSYSMQIIVVDDCSSDRTASLAEDWCLHQVGEHKQFLTLRVEKNSGKGNAIREALPHVRGQFVIVQDADLECSPTDYPALLEPLETDRADIVFGSRYSEPGNSSSWNMNRICVVLLNACVYLLYGKRLTDEACGYKVVRAETLREFRLECQRFEFCPEVTAKACLLGLRMAEVPVQYLPRNKAAGKKIRWWDGVHAFYELIRWRVIGFKRLPSDGPFEEAVPREALRG